VKENLNLPSRSTGRNYKLERTTTRTQKKKSLERDTPPRDENIILTGPEVVCLAKIMSNGRRAVTARWPTSQCEQVHGIEISLT
jgi:hypothetical protein